jgi:hypothetical protein
MWTLDHLILVTGVSALAVVLLPCLAFYLTTTRFSQWARAAHTLNASATLALCVILAVTLNHLWGMKRETDRRAWAARDQHRQRLKVLLKNEGDSLGELARSLRQRRYFTLVANDARQAVWRDEALTSDVVNHFPEYAHEREQLIQRILSYDAEMGRVRSLISRTIPPGPPEGRNSSELLSALVQKCGGEPPEWLHSLERQAEPDRGQKTDQSYQTYRCEQEISDTAQRVLDRADDLADATSILADTAKRAAEDDVLHGSCPYAPATEAESNDSSPAIAALPASR